MYVYKHNTIGYIHNIVLMTSNDAFTETIPDSNIEDVVSEVLDEIIDRIIVEDERECIENDTQYSRTILWFGGVHHGIIARIS